MNTSQIFTKKLIAEGKKGSIVNFSSAGSKKGTPSAVLYCSLKAGLDHLTRNMAVELAAFNIRVNAINPGVVLTAMMAECGEEHAGKYGVHLNLEDVLRRVPSPNKTVNMSDIVNIVLFLLSDAAVALIGNTVCVDGGLSIA